jgi:DNA-binding NarL/FixJ family response regulator
MEGVLVTVIDPAPAYRRGLAGALAQAGFQCEEVQDVQEWVRVRPGRRGVLFTVRSASDWGPLHALGESEAVVVALLVDATTDRHAEALRLGAHAAVPWQAEPERIVKVFAAALEDDTLLPVGVARAISAHGAPLQDKEWITPEEVEWLRFLAEGATVHELAEKVGYSERALYRVLHGLYGRLRVANRTEAILQAQRWGLLDDLA